MVDLSETQPDCERCGAERAGLLHDRSDLFLCRSCCADWDDENPDDTSLDDEPPIKALQQLQLGVYAASIGEARQLCQIREKLIVEQAALDRREELAWMARFLGPEKPLVSN